MAHFVQVAGWDRLSIYPCHQPAARCANRRSRLWRAHPGCCLPDLNQVAVRVPDVRADFGAMLLGLREERSAAR